jgi:hypothetical protein
MKAQSIGRQNMRGVATLEILIAFAVLTLSMGAIIMLSFGNQSVSVDSQTNNEAIYKAQKLLEDARAASRLDFNLVNPIPATQDVSGPLTYTKTLSVIQPDFFTKLASSTVSWQEAGRTLSVTFSTLLTNPQAVSGGDTCSSILEGDWTNPQISKPIDVEDPANSASGNPVTDIDVFSKKLYITTNNFHGNNADFYIFDSSVNPQKPTYRGSVKTITKNAGLNSVAISSTTATKYAYVASAYDPNFDICTTGPDCSQLQIINVFDPTLTPPVSITNFRLATNTPPYVRGNITGSNDQAIGKSIFYKNGFIYLGLSSTFNGPGFHIIDVGNGTYGGTPTNPVWVSSWPPASPGFGPSGAAINGIYVKGNYAYLSHPKNLVGLSGPLTEQITVLDISNPNAPQRVGSFSSIGGNGKVVYPVGNNLYFAKTWSNTNPELLVLNNSNPIQLSSNNPNPPGRIFGETINGIIVRSNLAFIVSSSTIQILDISNPSRISSEIPVKSWLLDSLVGSGSTGNASDCEGNNVYVGSYRKNNDKGVFLVIYPGIPIFDYALSNDTVGGNVTVLQGASTDVKIDNKLISGTTQPVTLSVSGLPNSSHITATFTTTNPCGTNGPTCSTTLNLATRSSSPTTPKGPYQVTVTGLPNGGGTGPWTTIFTLNVQ